MDDWKLKARVVVKLKRDANMLVSFYHVSCFISSFYLKDNYRFRSGRVTVRDWVRVRYNWSPIWTRSPIWTYQFWRLLNSDRRSQPNTVPVYLKCFIYFLEITELSYNEFRYTFTTAGSCDNLLNDNSKGRLDLGVNTEKIASRRSGPCLRYNNSTISG